jgi:GH25 family lysozyme M1 (1,4-beta-N-acetylmuramidase)
VKFIEEKYSNLIIFLQGFVGNTSNSETKKKFFEEQYRSWTYSSDEVIKTLNNLVELVKKNEGQKPNFEEDQKAIGNIVLE